MRYEVVIELRDVLVGIVRMRLRAFKEVALAVRNGIQPALKMFCTVGSSRLVGMILPGNAAFVSGSRIVISFPVGRNVCEKSPRVPGQWVRLRCS